MSTQNKSENSNTGNQNNVQLAKLERDLIQSMVRLRKRKGISQTKLAEMCNVKQPLIARMEASTHSPQINSLLKILLPLGYTLQIVPLKDEKEKYR